VSLYCIGQLEDVLNLEAETNSGSVLGRIVEARRASIAHRQRVLPEPVLRMAVKSAQPARDFAAALAHPQVNIISELKKASPSKGLLREDFRPIELAKGFENAGAAALSVLTEEEFFQGSAKDLRDARKACEIPVLRKDFIVDAWQVWEARAIDADSFLLIVAALSDVALKDLLALGRELGMEPLIEVHTRAELDRAITVGAKIIGVNNRDLKTLKVDLGTSFELVKTIPEECIAVCESGIRDGAEIKRLRAAGFDAFLIGEHLMTQADPGAGLAALIAGAI
jgi:indole-3-glycerol phosphate synthase